MNLLEEIQNAPVEWKELGKVAEIYNGLTGKNKTHFSNGNAKYVPYKNIFGNIQVDRDRLETVKVSSSEKQNAIKYGDVLFTGSSENIEEVGMSSAVTFHPEESVYLNSFSFGIRFNEDIEVIPEFSKYLFRSRELRKAIEKTASGVTRYNVSKQSFKRIKIPIPPLEIQEKIVQTLDKFTDYVTELTLRQKQYSYYRDYLLNFDQDSSGGANNKVEWKSLGEVCLSTKTISWKNEDGQKQFKYIDLSSVSRENKKITDVTIITKSTAPSRAQKIIKKDDILFATTRPMLKRFTKVTKEYNYQICSTGFCVLRPSDKILSNYLYHLVASSNFYDYVERNQSGTSYPAISDNLVKNYQFPLPPLSIQEKIVHVLDNFDTVCNDLNIGLPKEIELRQKQYEYFRDQLLTYTAEGVYTDSTVQYSTVQYSTDKT
ncbi:restriction endonuclease subunit S [Streptococcus sobrinus]|uniref:Type I restriction modification DNA specificity domain protein n=1 Tax=Streptococcus sobrinus W1703 TaxID=1227275 RepID=U2KHM1_9STRE|nr:restriction endonuclease subunit S [Streptococcus sobrinus]ERJ76674.1 type I restriction modification DNA specificity domain protein [Streptococcus sobrinus W1703]